MERIFISSLARGEMSAIRQATRRAVESLEMVPVMFEIGAASDQDSRRALLDRVAGCDALLLLLGTEYGEALDRGVSPTEEEFNEAVRSGVEVLPLVQDTQREPEQDAFLGRVRGAWSSGRLSASFTDAGDVAYAVTRTLNDWRRRREGGDTAPAAEARALELARGREHPGVSYDGTKLRVVAAPALRGSLIDAMALRDASLVRDLVRAGRDSEIIDERLGVDPRVGRDSITFEITGGRGFGQLQLAVGFDGAVVAEAPVGAEGGLLGGSAVMHDRAREVIVRSLAFADAVWRRIDTRDEVRDVFVATAVPEASSKVYATEPIGNSMSMGGLGQMPHVLIAPESPLRVRRADLSRADTVDRLQAELHRPFEIEGAVHPRADHRRPQGW